MKIDFKKTFQTLACRVGLHSWGPEKEDLVERYFDETRGGKVATDFSQECTRSCGATIVHRVVVELLPSGITREAVYRKQVPGKQVSVP